MHHMRRQCECAYNHTSARSMRPRHTPYATGANYSHDNAYTIGNGNDRCSASAPTHVQRRVHHEVVAQQLKTTWSMKFVDSVCRRGDGYATYFADATRTHTCTHTCTHTHAKHAHTCAHAHIHTYKHTHTGQPATMRGIL